jgi:hypothetical protein
MANRRKPWPVDLVDHKNSLLGCTRRIVGMATLCIEESKSGNPFFSNKIIPEIARKAEFLRDVAGVMIDQYTRQRHRPPKWYHTTEDVTALAMDILDDMRAAQAETRKNNYKLVSAYMERVTVRCLKIQTLLRSVPDPDPADTREIFDLVKEVLDEQD